MTFDEATNTTVLQDLHAQMKDKPFAPDLPELWQQLGIQLRGESVELQTDAPLATTRDAIMKP